MIEWKINECNNDGKNENIPPNNWFVIDGETKCLNENAQQSSFQVSTLLRKYLD